MDPTLILEADHRVAEHLIEQISESEGKERAELVERLRTEIENHMVLEEEVVYPAMAPITGEEAVDEGETEHVLAREALARVVELCPDGPGFEAALESMEAAIDHHVTDEEEEVFPKLRSKGREILTEMAEPFMAKRAELGMAIDVEALAETATRDDLRAEADAAGIDATSSMTKAELAGAIARSMDGS
jgi:iron-sulfur cluster repair protein YtfE (RIC family)